MALRKIGDIYHIRYFSLDKRDTLITTGESDQAKARQIHDLFYSRLAYMRKLRRLGYKTEDAPDLPAAIADLAMATKKKRYTFEEAFELYKQHTDPVPKNSEKNFFRFAAWAQIRYVDEVTPELAYRYLQENYAGAAGKSWNNNRNSLNAVFKKVLIPTGLAASPWENVPSRPNQGEHQRAVTDDEFRRIFAEADLLWRSAALISYWTGFRQESAFRFGPGHIKGGIIQIMPGKTARYNRAVRIPLHPQLAAYLATLPPSSDDTFLGFDRRKRSGGAFTRYFGELLRRLEIRDNADGIVVFNSIRNNFIERCRRQQLPEHAIRGMAGHVDSDMTDLYSQEIESAMPLLRFAPVKVKF